MRIIEPSVLIRPFNGIQVMKNIEWAGRVAYKSEDKITKDSYDAFIRDIIRRGHESVLEHEKLTVKFIVDRGVSHELVRHRIASFTQESTRYCNYGTAGVITVIRPFFFKHDMLTDSEECRECNWENSILEAEKKYLKLLELGASPQEARSVLPNSLKTEVVMTANIREWRHFLKLRCDKVAHPQMRQVAIPLRVALRYEMPPLFEDIEYDKDFDVDNYAEAEVMKNEC